MNQPSPDELEALLAEALAALDDGGEPALAAFVAAHPAQRPALERALARARQMGLVEAGPTRDFPDRLGEFRLLRRLGSGGMGVVYEAEQQSLARRVALKVVRPELLYFEGARERFRREIEAVARLSHPAIVPVLASGEQDGLPFYAMELLPGLSANELCQALQGRDPTTIEASDVRHALGGEPPTGTDPFAGAWWQHATRIVQQIALGVRHAHLRGIVHRDIKPGNVMLTPDGRTVLLDFGIARIAGGREFTRTGSNPGSPAFMSPEQLRGDAVDERTDVYSLGATLWQLLTLEAPFAGIDDLHRIQHGELPDVRSKNRDVPPELALVVATAMDVDRERRYADVGALAEDLHAVLQRRPIRARRLGPLLRTVRWCQRHRVTATMTAMLLGCLLLLPIVLALRERVVNRELAAKTAAAEHNLERALDSLDGILVSLSNDRLRYLPEAEPMMLEALGKAVALYRELLAENPLHPRLCADTCKALGRLAATQLRIGDRIGAIATYEQAIEVASRGNRDDPEVGTWHAGALLNLAGLHLEHGGNDRHRILLDAAEREYRRLIELPRRRSTALYGLSQVAAQRAEAIELATDTATVQTLLRDSLALLREALQIAPEAHEYRMALVRGLDNLATAHHDRKRGDPAALPLLDEALQVVRDLPADAPVWPPQPVLESDVLETLGNFYQHSGDPRARETLQRCVELRQPFVDRHPEDIELGTRLGGALHNLARTYCNNDEPDGYQTALSLLDRALPLQRAVLTRSPHNTRARLFLFFHLRLKGTCLVQLAGAQPTLLDELERVAAELAGDTSNAEHQRATARLWLRAMAMRGEGGSDHRDVAMQALLLAERAGWRSNSRLTEAVYAPLQDRDDFRALQQRLAAVPTAK